MAEYVGSPGASRDTSSGSIAAARICSLVAARAHTGAPAGGRLSPFRCECGDEGCTCEIRLTLAECESVRAYATHFVIALDHENPESEQVVEEHERFAVVATVSGEAAKLARRSDPRQRRR